jgi:hypothetical protein
MSQTTQSNEQQQQQQTLEVPVQQALAAMQIQQKKVVAPPTYFNLVKIYPEHLLANISNLTRGFNDLPPEVANWIYVDAYSRPFSFFGTIPAPPSTDLVKQIIGIDGYYLKLTTQKCLVDFIWHDRARNEFQFWGEYYSCVNAMNAIRYRICKYVERKGIANANANTKPTPTIASHVFHNDIYPNEAVCFEACVALDASGNYIKTLASKAYPDKE